MLATEHEITGFALNESETTNSFTASVYCIFNTATTATNTFLTLLHCKFSFFVLQLKNI